MFDLDIVCCMFGRNASVLGRECAQSSPCTPASSAHYHRIGEEHVRCQCLPRDSFKKEIFQGDL